MASRILVDYRKLAGMILAFAILYGEFFCHWSQAFWKWPTLVGSSEKDGDGAKWMRVLLVADPQLVGLQDEPPWPIGAITRWDADRYLAKTFDWALSRVGPLHAVAFMGDLIDEGSTTAYGPDYKSYVTRFRSIYPSESARHFIYVSGDNDVGGEGADPVTGAKVDRFRAFFPEKRVTEVRGAGGKVKVVVHNVITRVLDEADPDWELQEVTKASVNDTDRPITVMMSHIPVLHSHLRQDTLLTLNH